MASLILWGADSVGFAIHGFQEQWKSQQLGQSPFLVAPAWRAPTFPACLQGLLRRFLPGSPISLPKVHGSLWVEPAWSPAHFRAWVHVPWAL